MAFNQGLHLAPDYDDDPRWYGGIPDAPRNHPLVSLDDINDLGHLPMPVRPQSSVSNFSSNLSRSSGFKSQISYSHSVDGGILLPPPSTAGSVSVPPSEAGGVPVPPSTIGAPSAAGPIISRLDSQAPSFVPSRLHSQAPSFIPSNNFSNGAAIARDPFSGGSRVAAPTAYHVPPGNGSRPNTAYGNTHQGSSVNTFRGNGFTNGFYGSQGGFPTTPNSKTPRNAFGGTPNGHNYPIQFGHGGIHMDGQQNVPPFGTPGGRGRGRGKKSHNFSPHTSFNGYGSGNTTQLNFRPSDDYVNGYNTSQSSTGFDVPQYLNGGYAPQPGLGYTNGKPHAFHQRNQPFGAAPNNMSMQLYQPPNMQTSPMPYYSQQQYASPQSVYQVNNNMNPYGGNNSFTTSFNDHPFQQTGSMPKPVKNFNSFPPSTPRPSSKQMASRIRSGAYSDGKRCDTAYTDPDATPTRKKGDRRRHSVHFADTPSHTDGRNRSGNNIHSRNTSVSSTPSNSTLSTAVMLHGHTVPLPRWFNKTKTGMKPTIDEALASLPFMSPFLNAPTEARGVVKISNFPYGTLPSELLAALGKKATPLSQPQGSPYYAVHVIMDRMTGRTEEAFIEVVSLEEARRIVANIVKREGQGSRVLKVGSRVVDIDVGTQEELMSKLFPYAGGTVIWKGNTPRLVEKDTNRYAESARGGNFSGFVSAEETTAISKYAQNKTRSSFTDRIPHRVYESMISTLHKIPWHTPQFITLGQRKKLYDAARACIRGLVKTLRDKKQREKHPALTEALLRELIIAVLSCVGFSEQQKSAVIQNVTELGYAGLTTGYGMNVHIGGREQLSSDWPFLVLSPMPSIDTQVLDYYAALIAEATEDDSNMSLRDLTVNLTNDTGAADKPRPFGKLNIRYASDDMANMNLRDIAESEYRAIEHILRLELTSVVTLGPFELPP